MRPRDRTRLASVTIVGLAALLPMCCSTTGPEEGSPAPGSSEPAFFAYLREEAHPPALVALSPTNHDPRPAPHRLSPSRESIAADFAALRPAFDGLILYGYDTPETPLIVEEALRHGYRALLLGVWDPRSEFETAGVAALVDAYHDRLALAVCVGNEGIHFGRYEVTDVTAGIAQLRESMRSGATVPVCTSEPLVQYDRADVAALGDFLAMNIHPVFDRPDLGPDDSVAWVRERAMEHARTAGKPTLVKETGMPSGGDPRFSPAVQAAFWRSYTAGPRLVEPEQDGGTWVSFASAFEAFDLPWKADQTGIPIEAFWGLLGTDRCPRPAFTVLNKGTE